MFVIYAVYIMLLRVIWSLRYIGSSQNFLDCADERLVQRVGHLKISDLFLNLLSRCILNNLYI